MTSRKSTSRSPHEAVFSFTYADDETASRVHAAIEPEVGDIEGDRTRTGLALDGPRLAVHVEADDLVALRAGLNTWTTLVEVAEDAGGVAAST